MRPVVEALMSLRGIDLLAAVTLVAEIGDFQRFARPRELMGFLGLVPSEYSSGSTRRQGAITKAGNRHARRVLVEAAWNYRFPARVSRTLQVRILPAQASHCARVSTHALLSRPAGRALTCAVTREAKW
jgi:transposase